MNAETDGKQSKQITKRKTPLKDPRESVMMHQCSFQAPVESQNIAPAACDLDIAFSFLLRLDDAFGAYPSNTLKCPRCFVKLMRGEEGHVCRKCQYLVNVCSRCSRLMIFQGAYDEYVARVSSPVDLITHAHNDHALEETNIPDARLLDPSKDEHTIVATMQPALERLFGQHCHLFAYNDHIVYADILSAIETPTLLFPCLCQLIVAYFRFEWPLAFYSQLPPCDNLVYFWKCKHCNRLEVTQMD